MALRRGARPGALRGRIAPTASHQHLTLATVTNLWHAREQRIVLRAEDDVPDLLDLVVHTLRHTLRPVGRVVVDGHRLPVRPCVREVSHLDVLEPDLLAQE